MTIPEQDGCSGLLRAFPVTVCNVDGTSATQTDDVQVEHSVDVYINELLTMRIVCTPCNLPELIVGRMYTEGMIESADEVEEVVLYAADTRARVFLHDRKANFANREIHPVPTCCTGNRLLNSYFDGTSEPEPVVPVPWSAEDVFALARHFAQDTPMHSATSGTHSCYLARGGEVLYCCEDLGRHNAFDKVVGCALRDGVNLGQCSIFTSGRLPVDMVLKAIRSKIPILITKAVPTSTTVELAEDYNLTLICQARPDSFKVFNDPR